MGIKMRFDSHRDHPHGSIAKRRRAVFAIGFSSLIGLVFGASAMAAEPQANASAFEAPIKVLGGRVGNVALVVDSGNHVHAVASTRSGVWYVTNRTGTWTSSYIMPVTGTFRAWTGLAIALDAQERIHITASPTDLATPSTTLGIYYLTDRGRSPGTFPAQATRLVPTPAGNAAMKVFNGALYLAYESFCCYPGPAPKIMFSTNVSGHWTTTQVAKHGADPSLRIRHDGRARIAYDSGLGIRYAMASSRTGGFSLLTVPGSDASGVYANNPVLSLDLGDMPSIAWCRNMATTMSVVYSVGDTQAWHQPQTVQSGACDLSYDIDTLGRPNIAVADEGSTIRTWRLRNGAWHSQTVTTEFNGTAFALRRALSGRVDVLFSRLGGGLWFSHN